MKTFKLKKQFSLCLLVSLISNFVVGCDNNVGNVNGNEKATVISVHGQQQTIKETPINNVDEVWLNIARHDTSYDGGVTKFVIDNNTNSKITLVGCEGSQIDYSHMVYDSESSSPLRLDKNNGLLLPVQKQSPANVISFNATDGDDGKGFCYYKIHLNDMDKNLYVKLDLTKENFRTYSAIFDEVNRPYKEMESAIHASEPGWFKPVINSTIPAFATGAYGITYWLKNVSPTLQKSIRKAAFEKAFSYIEDIQAGQITALNEKLVAIRAMPEAAQEKAYNELLQELNKNLQGSITFNGNSAAGVTDAAKLEKLKEIDHFGPYEGRLYNRQVSTVIAFDKDGRAMTDGVRGLDPNAREFWMEANPDQWIKGARNLPEYKPYYEAITEKFDSANDLLSYEKLVGFNAEIRTSGIIPTQQPMAIGALLELEKTSGVEIQANEKAAIEFSGINKVPTSIITKDGEQVVIRNIEEEVVSKIFTREAVSAVVASTGFGLAVEAAVWFGGMPALSMVFFPDATGEFTTNMLHGKLGVPDASNIITWNAAHPDNRIEDSTILVGTSNNTYKQTLNIAPKAINGEVIDKSETIQLNLSALTTPFNRKDKINGHDPYDETITSNVNGSSVFTLSIDSLGSNNLNTRDLSMDVMKELFSGSGYSNLIPVLLPAPQVVSTKVNNYSGNSLTSYLTDKPDVLQSNGGSNGLKLTKVGALQGLFIKPNEVVTLGLQIPDRNNNDGNGYSLQYVSDDSFVESGNGKYQVVKSSSLFDKKASLGTSVLMATFDRSIPYKLHDTVNLNLAISSGNKLNYTSSGRLYVGDALGNTTAIPVYLNYALLAEPRSVEGSKNDSVSFTIANVSDKPYTSLSITGLPAGARVVTSNATAGLAPNEQRVITIDLSGMTDDTGNYSIDVVGNSSSLMTNDVQHVALSVTSGW